MPKPLRNDQGKTLKMYTILITGSGIVFDLHTSFAYTPKEALEDVQQNFEEKSMSSTMPLTCDIKGVVEVREFLNFLRSNIDDEVFSKEHTVFVKQPKFASTEATAFIQKLIDAAPALEEEETEQRILIKSLTKIKNLYENL